MHRLFVALSIPEVVADALTQLQGGVDGAAWRPVENFHLTLAFLGEVDRHGADEAASALSALSAPQFELTLSGSGFFGDERPRALWAGAAPEPGLDHLQAKVTTALRRVGLNIEKRKFVPHVTLAYARAVAPDAAARWATMHQMFRCGPFPVREFHLYESYLGGDISHYEIAETYPLSFSR